jgi:hypothetical protein
VEQLLNALQVRTDELAERVYYLLEEITTARSATQSDGSFPLDNLMRQIAEVEMSVGWITHIADLMEGVESGEEVLS